ncbi:glycosyltransferase [Pseudactinotalea terrae]|uniref:glycosyltransferase n=1 Tax=Pseudactinotalea terrae TaxID=1743262 RepID=UPI001F4FDA73|nr:glycosyltransferase [Pseudactinotalea terrae]
MTSLSVRARLLAHQVPPAVRSAALRIRWWLKGAPRVETARPVVAPGEPRLLVAPANFAGQGYAWSHAVTSNLSGASAVCVEIGAGALAMPSDQRIPSVVADGDREWARQQLAWVRANFSHVLLEAGRPLFGALFHRDVQAEIAALRESGLAVALIAHGTDVRLPSQHAVRDAWSPFRGEVLADLPLREHRARTVAAVFAAFDGPTFVSTPDLLDDVRGATWCPVVVDHARWMEMPAPALDAVPSVLHLPSRGPMKGSDLVDPVMRRMGEAGLIRYLRARQVASHKVPEVVQAADIVLDQFRIGSYGVAACEAMGAGRVVVGHVREDVRERVRATTGIELPIVEATPDDLEDVINGLAADPERRARIGRRGQRYVSEVHDGRASAQALGGWLAGLS